MSETIEEVLMEEPEVASTEDEQETKEFTIEIKISDQNLNYKSDFSEPETVFWIEAVKNLILQNSFKVS